LSEYLENYKGINRFAYVHLSTAHEKSGQRLEVLDSDFVSFFEKTLGYYKEINEDIVILTLSDHGRPKNSPIPLEARAEQMLPFTFMISSKSLIKTLTNFILKI
jgi:Protein of unknown function (DUF229).